MSGKLVILAVFTTALMSASTAKNEIVPEQDICKSILSCASCITKSFCTWCVTKSKCTKNSCGNDNIIYPKDFSTIMAGPQFCPRIVEQGEILTIKSGKKFGIVVKLTQIHMYMAFTPWKCRITFDGVETTVAAMLVVDSVYCRSVALINKSDEPYMSGSVSVVWDYSKSFDGSLPFRVCRCDLDPNCQACK